MKRRTIAIALLVNIGLFTSCGSDDDATTTTTAEVEAPATYAFSRDGASSVSFSGQLTRIKMAEELFDALKTGTETEADLLSMYDHAEDDQDFSETELNESDKQLKSKTAFSTDFFSTNIADVSEIRAKYDELITEQATNYATWDTAATATVAGYMDETDGTRRYFNENGVESNQFFAKALIGGLNVDQILNNYLSVNVLDTGINVENNNDGVLETGKNYTTMEHKWDEAYGYLFANEPDPTTFTTDIVGQLLNNYLKKVNDDEDFAGLTQEVYDAFKLGRAAIVAKNYTVRNAQANIIRQLISKVVAVRAVYYLQQGKVKLASDKADAFHDLSEGLGFVYSLMYTRESAEVEGSYFTFDEVDGYITDIAETDNGFWQEEEAFADLLDEVSNEIAAKFDFTVGEARN